MKKRIFASLLAVMTAATMTFAGIGSTVMAAEGKKSFGNDIFDENGSQMEYLQVPDEELEPCEIVEESYNVMERQQLDNTIVFDDVALYSDGDDETDDSNTNPNYAESVVNDMAYLGAIEEEEEIRWYTAELATKSKVSVFVKIADTLDADLYIFELDEDTSELNFVTGSAVEGLGESEYVATVLEAGTYYFAIIGYEGTGNFVLAYFQSSADANYEVNDTLSMSTNVSFNTGIVGVIDSPLDIDFYSVTTATPAVIKYNISS